MIEGGTARSQTPGFALAEAQLQDEPRDAELLVRFHRDHDAGAFEALVRRHGPLVLGVCRRVLGRVHDAEDAFQATFMVLARKAGLIAMPELLGNWLHGVAYRIACKARVQAARRWQSERKAATATTLPGRPVHVAGPELRWELEENLRKLPAKFRDALVLCYLEGLTNLQAARRLGWRAGSIFYRLARGRELLRQQLADLDP